MTWIAPPDGSWDREAKIVKAALPLLNPQRAADFDQVRLIGRIAHGVSDELLDAWSAWAVQHPWYTRERCAECWTSFARTTSRRVGLGLLIKYVRADTGSSTFPEGVGS